MVMSLVSFVCCFLQRPMLSGSLCQVPNWVFTLYNKVHIHTHSTAVCRYIHTVDRHEVSYIYYAMYYVMRKVRICAICE